MTTILASTLVALAMATASPVPAAPPASAPQPSAPVFTPFKGWPSHAIGIDTNSFHSYPGPTPETMPVIGLDIELTLTQPEPYLLPPSNSPVLVKRYVNTLAVDCANDRLLVVVSRGYDVAGKQVFVYQTQSFVQNGHVPTTPVAEIMDNLICPPLLKKFKRNEEPEQPKPVTIDPRTTA